ncbi:transcription-repair coupling factor, partial [Catenibacterium mitsuokai]|nr:transcription-repair coupling factor [Catenibacterium mitsuokai]
MIVMEKILNLLKDNQALRTLDTDNGTIVTNSTSDEAYLIAGSFWHNPRKILIIKNNQYEAFNLYKTLTELVNQVVYFPADESLRVESVAYSYELLGERINALYAMTQDKPMICVCHMHSMTRYITPVDLFKKSIISLKKGDTIDPLELKKMLQFIGYKNTQRVDSPFYYSRRGEVLDVYTIQYEHPVRIEFFDDEIEEISFYDKDSQRRTNKIESIDILPATDMM